MSIHFKFKSAKEFDTVTFPGTVIRVLDLKKAIIEKKKLNKGLDFDLVITDAQNGKVYDDENMQLPRNTSVTVKRIPSQQPGSGLLARMKAEAAAAAAAAAPVMVPSPVIPMGVPMPVPPMPLNAAPASSETTTSDETVGAQTMEDELAALQSIHEQAEDMRGARLGNKTWTAQGGSNADKVMNYYSGGRGGGPGGGGRGFMGGGRGPMGGRGEFGGAMGGRGRGGAMGGPPGMHNNNPNQAMGNPPPNYVCYRCGTPGHYIQNCPTNGDPEYDQHRVKKKTGIPKSFMKAVNDPSEIPVGAGKTVVNAPWGGLAVIEPQNKNFSKLMAKSGGSATLDQFIANPPDHLACPLCKRLMNDAVLIPCCQESACDECLRSALIEKKLTCPLCNTTNMSPEKLLPNKVLRTSVDEFLRRARTEQQEREQLVKEAEEKALAKQKAEMAVSTAGRRSGESADATLEIKKGKKDEDDEEDEFGGDIFGSALLHKLHLLLRQLAHQQEKILLHHCRRKKTQLLKSKLHPENQVTFPWEQVSEKDKLRKIQMPLQEKEMGLISNSLGHTGNSSSIHRLIFKVHLDTRCNGQWALQEVLEWDFRHQSPGSMDRRAHLDLGLMVHLHHGLTITSVHLQVIQTTLAHQCIGLTALHHHSMVEAEAMACGLKEIVAFLLEEETKINDVIDRTQEI
uniref:Uncharacterized protein n=1 Tax=Globisporangium ultimum (strain ATCC 200006 / CBS 805.95 / DAOM BR144) TaxID=431595 RepID=K3X144_GLOUD